MTQDNQEITMKGFWEVLLILFTFVAGCIGLIAAIAFVCGGFELAARAALITLGMGVGAVICNRYRDGES